MIHPSDIRELLAKEPFTSFRIRMADGNSYVVTNPGLVVPMDSQLFVALPNDRWKFLSYFMMTSVENGGVAKRRPRGAR
jgi:hypothetical protein